jgi:hypothetical protein
MVVNGRFIVVVLWTIENPKPLVDNQSDILSHFLDMSCNEQVATNILLWTPLARRKALSESYAMHTILC